MNLMEMHLPEEDWRPISGYTGIYEVSSRGRVRVDPACVRPKSSPGRILRQRPGTFRYPLVGLCKDGQQRTFTVHRLVARAFVAGYREGLHVNHKDLNPTNNHHSNLEWVTPLENVRHATANGHIGRPPKGWSNPRKGELSNKAKLKTSDVVAIRKSHAMGNSYYAIAKKYGMADISIKAVVLRRTWKHVP